MHRNVARAYDCLQTAHTRVRAACIKTLSQKDEILERQLLRANLTTQDTTTKCISTKSVYHGLSGDGCSISRNMGGRSSA